jgi:deoxyribonuclease V
LVAGLDISGADAQGRVRGAVVLLRWDDMAVVEVQRAEGTPALPYIPGLLAFREVPVLLEALERLEDTPDLILVDGQGLAHPRRFGIACHIGLMTQVPTVGCAKSILRGRHGPLGPERGAWAELVDRDEVVGAAVRSRDAVSPVYVSIGHRVDLPTAIQWVLACCRGRRLPEPARRAHQAAGAGHLPTGPAAPVEAYTTLF